MATSPKVIIWDRPKLERFKIAWASAPGDKQASFIFDTQTFIKGYAEYLIEHLESKCPRDPEKQN